MDAYKEELFGPVLAVIRVDTLDEAIGVNNANPYGNGTALFTGSGEAARRFQRNVKVGMIGVNMPMSYYSFGDRKTPSSATPPSTAPRASASTPGPRSSTHAGRSPHNR